MFSSLSLGLSKKVISLVKRDTSGLDGSLIHDVRVLESGSGRSLHPGASIQELAAAQRSPLSTESLRVTYEPQVSIPITWGISLQTSKTRMQAATTFHGPARASYG